MAMNYPAEREHYRVVYPLRARPRIVIEGQEYLVFDCSEGGVRYQLEAAAAPEIGTTVVGRIRFRRGAEVEVAGHIVRVENGAVAVRLDRPGIGMANILDEQRYLRTNFPMHG
jgi:hypothetical protein